MKRYLTLSMIAAALLLAGCSDETKEKAQQTVQSAAQDAQSATKSAQQKASEAMEEAKRQAAEALEQARQSGAEALEAGKQKSAELAQSAKEAAAEAAKAVEESAKEVQKQLTKAEEPGAGEGATLFAKCAGCHGSDGKTKALEKSPAIAGMEADKVAEILREYKEGKRDAYGMGALMKAQVASLNDTQIEALAKYISSLK